MIDTDILSAYIFIIYSAFLILYMERKREIKGWKQWVGFFLFTMALSNITMVLLFSEFLYTESSAFIFGKIGFIIFALSLGSYLLFKRYKKKK